MKDPFVSNYKAFVTRAKARNEAYEAASPAQKRVALAKDVLLHVQAKRLEPQCGTYGDTEVSGDILADDVSLRDVMVEEVFECKTCARGSLVYAAIMRRNKMFGSRFNGNVFIEEFPVVMFCAIETAFEADDMHDIVLRSASVRMNSLLSIWERCTSRLDYGREEWTQQPKFVRFANTIAGTALYRLERIMRWLIDHDGEFDLQSFLEAELLRFPKEAFSWMDAWHGAEKELMQELRRTHDKRGE